MHAKGLWKVEHWKPFTTCTYNKPSAFVHFTHPKSRVADVSNRTHFTWLSPFLYSSEQSRRTMRGFLIRRRILGWVTSLFTMIPRKTHESSLKPPGIWQTQGREKIRWVSLAYKNLCIWKHLLKLSHVQKRENISQVTMVHPDHYTSLILSTCWLRF